MIPLVVPDECSCGSVHTISKAAMKLGRARASGTRDIHKPYGLDTKQVLRLYTLHSSDHQSHEIIMKETIHNNIMET